MDQRIKHKLRYINAVAKRVPLKYFCCWKFTVMHSNQEKSAAENCFNFLSPRKYTYTRSGANSTLKESKLNSGRKKTMNGTLTPLKFQIYSNSPVSVFDEIKSSLQNMITTEPEVKKTESLKKIHNRNSMKADLCPNSLRERLERTSTTPFNDLAVVSTKVIRNSAYKINIFE
jgi:hypothetical protein